jgi:DNA-binding transcriptional LysR family regulator
MIRTPSLRALDLFATLMSTRSLTNAAQRIGISQPAASLALKELEAQTGLTLFVRTKQRIVPTPQAEALLPHVERLIAQADAVQLKITTLQTASASTIRLACIPSFGSTLLPKILVGFQREQPRVQLKVDVQHLAKVLDLVRQEAAELGFAYLPDDDGEKLMTIRLACLIAPDHPLAAKTTIGLDDLAGHTSIVATKGYIPIPAAVMDVLRRNDDQPGRGVLEVNNVYTAMALAREGIGVALANPLLLLGAEAHGLVGRLFEPSISLTLGIVRALPHEHTPEILALITQAHMAAWQGAKHLTDLGMDAHAF